MHECFACHLALQPVVQSRGGRKLQVVLVDRHTALPPADVTLAQTADRIRR
jgi:hypothetical protein